MHSNANIAMNAILIGIAFLTTGISLQRNFLFVNSATVALQTSTDLKPTTSNDYTQTTLSTTTDRYPKLYAENDNYGKQTERRTHRILVINKINKIDVYRLAITCNSNTLTALDNYYIMLFAYT